MKNKKFLSVLLMVVMLLSLAACGNSASTVAAKYMITMGSPIRIDVDKNNNVIDVELLNEKAVETFSGTEFSGLSLNSAVKDFISTAVEKEALHKGDKVTVRVLEVNAKRYDSAEVMEAVVGAAAAKAEACAITINTATADFCGKEICETCFGSGYCATCGGSKSSVGTCGVCGGMAKCRYCAGKGDVTGTCPICGGSGSTIDICSRCDGSHWATCTACGGTGETEKGSECTFCGGKGKIECLFCDDTGLEISECTVCGGEGTYSGACPVCGGSGNCLYCNGEGIAEGDCIPCGGTGRCPDCDGYGYHNHEDEAK